LGGEARGEGLGEAAEEAGGRLSRGGLGQEVKIAREKSAAVPQRESERLSLMLHGLETWQGEAWGGKDIGPVERKKNRK